MYIHKHTRSTMGEHCIIITFLNGKELDVKVKTNKASSLTEYISENIGLRSDRYNLVHGETILTPEDCLANNSTVLLYLTSTPESRDPFNSFYYDYPTNPLKGEWNSKGEVVNIYNDNITGRLKLDYVLGQTILEGWLKFRSLENIYITWTAKLYAIQDDPYARYDPSYLCEIEHVSLKLRLEYDKKCLNVRTSFPNGLTNKQAFVRKKKHTSPNSKFSILRHCARRRK